MYMFRLSYFTQVYQMFIFLKFIKVVKIFPIQYPVISLSISGARPQNVTLLNSVVL